MARDLSVLVPFMVVFFSLISTVDVGCRIQLFVMDSKYLLINHHRQQNYLSTPGAANVTAAFQWLECLTNPILNRGGIESQGTRTFTIVNNCKETVWPGITHGENFKGSGFTLKPGQSAVYMAPTDWGGRIWGRTGCSFDNNGHGTCQTGGCGTSINCTSPGSPPASIAEFTLGEVDYYDVSLVDGFNLPMVIIPLKGKENCTTVGCDGDLRKNCPSELALNSSGKVIACRSACDMFNTDEYCCRGMFGDAATCHPSNYSRTFKSVCPVAYSYAYDDPTSIKTCTGAEYVVSFCSSRNGTVCSYHNTTLSCNASNSASTIFGGWGIPMLALPLLLLFSSLYL